ncbi:MKRN2 opposite strand protein isoform X2 [Dendropsophus ebraccatus]|uniref:MKRN2 opposite strand protein isoform X2 n=1 Tax=Dendropsophus ebraccatus TaxID=150705 RepID=UPI00383190D8
MAKFRDQEGAEMPQPPAPSLVKVTHCNRDIYSSSVPLQCPICGQNPVSSWDLEQAPVSIPSPFVNAHREKCSFVLRPTKGRFLGDYDGCSDLHVGITSSKGIVHHYNETGTHKDTIGWEQCVSIPLVPPDQYALIHQWDTYLEEFSCKETWLPNRYDEKEHNCYTYALKFINGLLHLQEKKTFTKEEFTEKFVLPRTRRASKYITLCHEVSRNYYYIVDASSFTHFSHYMENRLGQRGGHRLAEQAATHRQVYLGSGSGIAQPGPEETPTNHKNELRKIPLLRSLCVTEPRQTKNLVYGVSDTKQAQQHVALCFSRSSFYCLFGV